MLIRTEDQTAFWKYWNLFDTETGLRYSLYYPVRDREGADVKLSINSAHSKSTEDSHSMTYQGIEALDFWALLALLDGTPWGGKAHKEATEVLRQIQKDKAEVVFREEQRREELDELDLPF